MKERAITIAAILQSKGGEVLAVECDTSVRDAVALLAEGARCRWSAPAGSTASCGARRHLLPEERRRGRCSSWTVERMQ